MTTTLVTGGAGFLGSHLCEALLEQGKKVICVDNYITGKKENIEEFLKNKNFSVLEHDITKPIKIKVKIDEIYNFASPASPEAYGKFPIETMLTNSLGTYHILELARKNDSKFLQASTSEVYGDPLEHPQKETYFGNVNPTGPRSCYDEGKRFAEALIMNYHRKYNLNTKIVRIFNTYGPKMRADDGRAIPNFIMQALDNRPITIYGKGDQTRSFCYVSDLIDGVLKVMDCDYNNPINLGNPNEITIRKLAEIIIKLTNSRSKMVSLKALEDDPYKRRPDISLAKSLLAWEPKVSLEDGLKRTIDFFYISKNQS